MSTTTAPPATEQAAECPAVAQVVAFVGWLAQSHLDCSDDKQRIDLLRALESVKGAAAAAQARVTADFIDSQTEAASEKAGNVADDPNDPDSSQRSTKPSAKAEALNRRSIRGQVALARRCAPHRGSGQVSLAEALTSDLPFTMNALARGQISEWQAMLIARETACLTAEQRRQVDTELALHLGILGDRRLAEEARKIAFRLAPDVAEKRLKKQVGDRTVTLRRRPDSMAYVTAFLPAAAAVACHAALARGADLNLAAGDPARRGRGQLMADIFTQRLTGGVISGCDEFGGPIVTDLVDASKVVRTQRATSETRSSAAGPDPSGETAEESSPVDRDQPDRAAPDSGTTDAGIAEGAATEHSPAEHSPAEHDHSGHRDLHFSASKASGPTPQLDIHLHLVMTDRALFGCDDEPAELVGYGIIPIELARRIAGAALGPAATTWIRRLYTDPDSGQLAAMDARSREFPDTLKHFLIARDRTCRTPYCGADGRHFDHVMRHADGGTTSSGNGQFTSADCNYLKEAPGWRSDVAADGTITVTTPTGHTYPSPQPPPPSSPVWSMQGIDADLARAADEARERSRRRADDAVAPSDSDPADWRRPLSGLLDDSSGHRAQRLDGRFPPLRSPFPPRHRPDQPPPRPGQPPRDAAQGPGRPGSAGRKPRTSKERVAALIAARAEAEAAAIADDTDR